MLEIQRISKGEVGDLLFDHTKLALCFVGKDGQFLRVNPELSNLLGYTEYELVRKKFADITHPEDLMADMELLTKTLAGEISGYPMTKRYITKDGHIIWVRLIVTAVEGHHDAVACFFSQIIPLEGHENDHERVSKYMKSTSSVSDMSIIKKISKEWKWILMFSITLIGGYITWNVNTRVNAFKREQRFQTIEDSVSDLKTDINEIKRLIVGDPKKEE